MREWADAVVTLLSSANVSDKTADRARIAVEDADAYIRLAIDERLRQPNHDLLSTLAQAQQPSRPSTSQRP